MMRPLGDCRTCGGTGWQWLLRTWFRGDGYRKSRCGVCGGTGKSNYRDDPAFIRGQAEIRRALGNVCLLTTPHTAERV